MTFLYDLLELKYISRDWRPSHDWAYKISQENHAGLAGRPSMRHQRRSNVSLSKGTPWWSAMDELGFPSQWTAWLLLFFRASGALHSAVPARHFCICSEPLILAFIKCLCSWRGGIIPIRLLPTAEGGSENGPYWVINTLFRESYTVPSIWKWKPALGRGSTSSMLARMMLPEWPGTTP